ncbi:hypothetical protein ACHHYP_11108, partial [Achlya hypogyna]
LCLSFQYNPSSQSQKIPITLYAKTNGKIVGVTDSDTFMYTPVTGNPLSNQQFVFLPATQQLQVVGNGKCLDAYPNAGVAAGFSVHLWSCDATNANQRWRINAAGHQISHATHANLCLDADPTDSQSRLQVWQCAPLGTNPNQFFGISSVTAEPATLTTASGLRFSAAGTAQGNGVLFSSGPGVWNFNFMTNQVVLAGTTQCLDAWQPQNGGGVHIWGCDATNANQRWKFDATTGQLRHLTHAGYCLDMQSDSGATSHLWSCHATDSAWIKYQKFKYQNQAVPLP